MKTMRTFEQKAFNNAIISVLTHQFKKDDPVAHEIVKDAGYKIYKSNGHFVIRNPKTSRTISITVNRYGKYYASYGYYYVNNKYFNTKEDLRKMDFVNCLEKPVNREFHERDDVPAIHKKYSEKKYDIQNARWNVTYYGNRADAITQQIAKLQKELVQVSMEQGRYKEKLSNMRKELGLTKTF